MQLYECRTHASRAHQRKKTKQKKNRKNNVTEKFAKCLWMWWLFYFGFLLLSESTETEIQRQKNGNVIENNGCYNDWSESCLLFSPLPCRVVVANVLLWVSSKCNQWECARFAGRDCKWFPVAFWYHIYLWCSITTTTTTKIHSQKTDVNVCRFGYLCEWTSYAIHTLKLDYNRQPVCIYNSLGFDLLNATHFFFSHRFIHSVCVHVHATQYRNQNDHYGIEFWCLLLKWNI